MKLRVYSYFREPITTTVPAAVCNLEAVHSFITTNERLKCVTEDLRVKLARSRGEYRASKPMVLPSVTPAGVFDYRRAENLVVASGDFVIDVDHLASEREAEELRDQLFADEELLPDLAFKSPSGLGFKLFVPYRVDIHKQLKQVYDNAVRNAWLYMKIRYNLDCDIKNIDICRSCFLCHDEGAKIRV